MKTAIYLFILLTSIFFSISDHADYYRVNVQYDLNVRASASQNSRVVGKLYNSQTVDVSSFDNGWACINYNGSKAYVKASFLTPVAGNDKLSSEKKTSWNFFSWLFSSDGEYWWFTLLKWAIIIGIGIYLIKVAFEFIIAMLGGGAVCWIAGWVLALILDSSIGLSVSTFWAIPKWGGYIGAAIGLIYSIINFRDVHEKAKDPHYFNSESPSAPSGSGLKQYSVLDEDGHRHTFTQTSRYSECNFRDEDGNDWDFDGNKFTRR